MGWPQMGAAIGGLAGVLGRMHAWFQHQMAQTTQCQSNCCSCVQGQLDRHCDQVATILDTRLDKIGNALVQLLGEAQGRLLSATPYQQPQPTPGTPLGAPMPLQPGDGQPLGAVAPSGPSPLHAVGPTGPPSLGAPTGLHTWTGSAGTSSPTGYQPTGPYNPFAAGTLPSGMQQPIQVPGQQPFAVGQPTGSFPGPGSAGYTPEIDLLKQGQLPPGTQLIQVPGGPCWIYFSCFSYAYAMALAAAISDAIINAVTVLFTGAQAPGVTIPGAQTPNQPNQQQPPKDEKYESEYQYESGPTLYTKPLDRFYVPDTKDSKKTVDDEQGQEVL